jgi:hypothetical protein
MDVEIVGLSVEKDVIIPTGKAGGGETRKGGIFMLDLRMVRMF